MSANAPNAIDLDLACAVAVNLVEHPMLRVTPVAVTLLDARQQTVDQVSGWASAADPLHMLARDYLMARRDAMLATTKGTGSHWGYSGAARGRDLANRKAIQAKNQARTLLEERGVLQR